MNARGKIVFVVGHKQWGKSTTLRMLTADNFRVRRHSISGVDFFIRRMSNDDATRKYIDFMRCLDPAKSSQVIAALCPKFDDRNNPTEEILRDLQRKGFRMFFWVLRKEQGGGDREISPSEISQLQKYGEVEVYQMKSPPKQNAKMFSKFVTNRVLA